MSGLTGMIDWWTIMTRQVVKIFRRKYGKNPLTGTHGLLQHLEQVINNFLKEHPDHRIILVQYNARSDEYESESALIVFEVSESSSGGGGHGSSGTPPKRHSGRYDSAHETRFDSPAREKTWRHNKEDFKPPLRLERNEHD